MEDVDHIAEVCDWKTQFGPEEIVNMIAGIIEKNKDIVELEPVKIIQRDYNYECGDGCCDESGKEWYINDDKVCIHRSPCEDNGWLCVLKELGFDAEIEFQDESGEEICSL